MLICKKIQCLWHILTFSGNAISECKKTNNRFRREQNLFGNSASQLLFFFLVESRARDSSSQPDHRNAGRNPENVERELTKAIYIKWAATESSFGNHIIIIIIECRLFSTRKVPEDSRLDFLSENEPQKKHFANYPHLTEQLTAFVSNYYFTKLQVRARIVYDLIRRDLKKTFN